MNEIQSFLFENRDEKYKAFQAKLIPSVDGELIIGVRTPELKKFAKELIKRGEAADFLADLPHKYFEENQLHSFIISDIKNFEKCIYEIQRFLPFIDNWATCDQLKPKAFSKNKDKLLDYILIWIKSEDTYTVRFAIEMLMTHFLDESFKEDYLKMVAEVKSEEYYINMMIAWYFATALAKQYEKALPFIENNVLDKWTHNKTIQKSVESFRITDEQKEYLKTLKIKS